MGAAIVALQPTALEFVDELLTGRHAFVHTALALFILLFLMFFFP